MYGIVKTHSDFRILFIYEGEAMRIRLQTTFSKEFIELEREQPFAIEDLAKEYQDQSPYRILLARVNGVDRELSTMVFQDADIRLYRTLARDHRIDQCLTLV